MPNTSRNYIVLEHITPSCKTVFTVSVGDLWRFNMGPSFEKCDVMIVTKLHKEMKGFWISRYTGGLVNTKDVGWRSIKYFMQEYDIGLWTRIGQLDIESELGRLLYTDKKGWHN
jgi:hypothetical protein